MCYHNIDNNYCYYYFTVRITTNLSGAENNYNYRDVNYFSLFYITTLFYQCSLAENIILDFDQIFIKLAASKTSINCPIVELYET